MLKIICSGSPREIGLKHGEAAETQIRSGVAFYQSFFNERCSLNWGDVQKEAEKALPFLEQEVPDMIEEIRGIADGTHLPFLSVLALNVRTEIAYGLYKSNSQPIPTTDGCTAISWNGSASTEPAILAQNWDWRPEQRENLVHLTVKRTDGTTIAMVTEAGIIGKIGLNDHGVGVCLNAIRAQGVDWERLPVHLALRACLDSKTREEAYQRLKRIGIASACHILLADAKGAMGLESSYKDLEVLDQDPDGFIVHTNHYVRKHQDEVIEDLELNDSLYRIDRAKEMSKDLKDPSVESIWDILSDKTGSPTAICRSCGEGSEMETLFGIVMDLEKIQGQVIVGRPGEGGEKFVLSPDP